METQCRCGKCKQVPKLATLRIADKLREGWGPLIVSSGARCADHNRRVGGAKNSAHVTGEAMDLRPVDLSKIKEFQAYCIKRAEELDIYIEDPDYTKTWLHFQIRKTASGKRVFRP